ncbi:hypothetical protein JXR93_05975 [bacterium]|nr:hypothetical protein [bacterium]
MLSLYLTLLIIGGFFVGMSAIMGGGDHDVDHDVDGDLDHDMDGGLDHDVDHEVDHDVDHEADHDSDHDAGIGDLSWYMPILSFKFWTFFSMTTGMTGSILTFLGKKEPLIALVSFPFGFIAGYLISYTIKKLRNNQTNSTITMADYEGQVAKVVIPFDKGERGKISMNIKGEMIEMIALSESDESFEKDQTCIILEVKENYCVVVPANSKYLED